MVRTDAALADRVGAQLPVPDRKGGFTVAAGCDASPDIAEAWGRSKPAPYFDAAVFSWSGTAIPGVEALPSLLSSWRDR
jgi:hypothetical protein